MDNTETGTSKIVINDVPNQASPNLLCSFVF